MIQKKKNRQQNYYYFYYWPKQQLERQKILVANNNNSTIQRRYHDPQKHQNNVTKIMKVSFLFRGSGSSLLIMIVLMVTLSSLAAAASTSHNNYFRLPLVSRQKRPLPPPTTQRRRRSRRRTIEDFDFMDDITSPKMTSSLSGSSDSRRSTTTDEETASSTSSTKILDLKELGMDRIEYPLRLLQQQPKEEEERKGGAGTKGIVSLWTTTVGLIASALYYFWSTNVDGPQSSFSNISGNDWWKKMSKRGGGKLHQSSHTSSSSSSQRKTTPAEDHPLTLQSQTMIQQKGRWKWLLSFEKLPWTIASLLSLTYLLAFVSRVSCDKASPNFAKMCWSPLTDMTSRLHNGFCIWGSNPTTGICPSREENSHQFSFYIDTIMVFLTFGVGHYYHYFYNPGKANNQSNKTWRPTSSSTTTTPSPTRPSSFAFTAGLATIIGLHGLLHFGISNGIQCTPPDGPWYHCGLTCPNDHHNSPTQPWQWILYGIYNLGLVVLDFGVANFRLPIITQVVFIGIITTIFVALGIYLGEHWALPAVFVQTHVLASVTGIFANRYRISPLVGWWFVGATIVGMTEFLGCQSFLLDKGGHVWYDTVLHLAMIATLVPRGAGDLQ